MARSTTLAEPVSGGVRQRAVLQAPGTAAWITTAAMPAEASTIRRTVSRCVASGIRPAYRQAGSFTL